MIGFMRWLVSYTLRYQLCDTISDAFLLSIIYNLSHFLLDIRGLTMADEIEGEEFVVDKILDKRTRNGKIEYYLSWKVSSPVLVRPILTRY